MKSHRFASLALLLSVFPVLSGHADDPKCLTKLEAALEEARPPQNPALSSYEAYRAIGLKPQASLDSFEPATGIFLKRDGAGHVLRNADGSPVEARMRALTDNPNDKLYVIGDFNNWGKDLSPEELARYELKPVPGTRYHEGVVPGLRHGQRYRFLLNGPQAFDPAAGLFTTPQFNAKFYGVNEPYLNSVFWDFDRPGAYHPSNPGPDLARRHVTLGEQEVWYLVQGFPRPDGTGMGPASIADTFAFIGDPNTKFVPTFKKTFEFNAIHFLPLGQSMKGETWPWRYQVYGPFAPDSRYGNPDELVKAIDTLHEHGVAVILDFLGSHVPYKDEVSDIGHMAWKKEDGHPVFTRNPTQWDTRRWDYENPFDRRYLIDSVLTWFKRYNIDGIRVDNVGADGIERQPGGRQFLIELSQEIRKYRPHALIIHEDVSGSHQARSLPLGGLGANARNGTHFFNWFRENAQRKSEDLDMNGWRTLLRDAWTQEELGQVPYISNHDEAAHFTGGATGAFPATLLAGNGEADARGKVTAFDAAAMVIGAYSEHTGYARLMQPGSMSNDPTLDWSRLKNPDVRNHARFLADLSKYVNQEPAFAFENLHENLENHTDYANKVASVLRIDRRTGRKIYVLLNFSPNTFRNYRFGVADQKPLRLALDRDSREYGGSGRNEDASREGDLPALDASLHGKPHSVSVPYLAPYSVVVLEQP